MRLTILITFFLMRAFSAEAKIEREDMEIFSNPAQSAQKIDFKMLVFSGEGELCLSDLRDKKGLLPPSLRSELADESELSKSEIPACDENTDHAFFNLAERTVYEGEEVAVAPAALAYPLVMAGSSVLGCFLGLDSAYQEQDKVKDEVKDYSQPVVQKMYKLADEIKDRRYSSNMLQGGFFSISGVMLKILARDSIKKVALSRVVFVSGSIIILGGGLFFGAGFCGYFFSPSLEEESRFRLWKRENNLKF